MNTIKFLIIGPAKSGKTTIANILADLNEGPTSTYRPTVACRIVEFEKEPPSGYKKYSGKIPVEIWDISGDPAYEKCWPAIIKGAHGIIFVYDTASPSYEKDIDYYVNEFPKKHDIPPKQCMAYAHHLNNGDNPVPKTKPAACLKGVAVQDATAENISTIVVPFEKHFAHLLQILSESQDKEEKQLMDL